MPADVKAVERLREGQGSHLTARSNYITPHAAGRQPLPFFASGLERGRMAARELHADPWN